MALESQFNGPDDLNTSWPTNAQDPVAEGANHLRGVKAAVKAAIGGNGTQADLKYSGNVVLRTIAAGWALLVSTVERGRIYAGGTGNVELIVEASSNSGAVRMRAKDVSGVASTALLLSAAGQVISHAGQSVAETRTTGLAVKPGASADPILAFETAAGVSRGTVTGGATGVVVQAPAGQAVTIGPAGSTGIAVGASTVSMATRRLTGLGAGTAADDAATKGYVDGLLAATKIAATGLLTPPGTTKLRGCTAVKGAVGLWTVTLTTPLSAIGNAMVQATCGGGTAVPTETGLASYTVDSTSTVRIWTREVNDSATLVDLPVSFLIMDLGV